MAYTKTEWIPYQTTVSAELLNKIEDQLQTVTSNAEMNEMEIKSTKSEVKELDSKIELINSEIKELDSKIESISENINSIISSNEELHKIRKTNSLQDKEIAYLKLKKEAADRIEGGTTFADDFGGNGFGITFNAEESENVLNKDGGLTMNVGSMVEHNVEDSIIAGGAPYTTLDSNSRKLVRLDNGWLVAAFKNASTTDIFFYTSTDNGATWEYTIKASDTDMKFGNFSIVAKGTMVYAILFYNMVNASTKSVIYTGFDPTTRKYFNGNSMDNYPNIRQSIYNIQSSQNSLDSCSLTINEERTELHACWASKNSTYPNSFNIQYCKGTIGESGKITWGTVEQITTFNSTSSYARYPCIVLNAQQQPIILHYYYASSSSRRLGATYYDGSTWRYADVFNSGGAYTQYTPSAIFVPKSVNGLENGRIWVTWSGEDSIDTARNNIKISYSDDNGATWSEITKLSSRNTYSQFSPSITANKNNEIFVTWYGYTANSTSNHVLTKIKWSDNYWGETEEIKQLEGKHLQYPSTLIDFNIDFNNPILVYTINDTSVNFTGSWTAGGYTPSTTATAVYKLPSTDYVGLFVQKKGNIDVAATINGEPMESELDGDEYQFTKVLDNKEPATIKLLLSRENTLNGDNDKVTRILGGIS